jgi:hypothetical protein
MCFSNQKVSHQWIVSKEDMCKLWQDQEASGQRTDLIMGRAERLQRSELEDGIRKGAEAVMRHIQDAEPLKCRDTARQRAYQVGSCRKAQKAGELCKSLTISTKVSTYTLLCWEKNKKIILARRHTPPSHDTQCRSDIYQVGKRYNAKDEGEGGHLIYCWAAQ